MSINELTGREPLEPPIPLPEPAERIRLREAFGITQIELARALHVALRTIYVWERGISEPTGENREHYAAVLHTLSEKLKRA